MSLQKETCEEIVLVAWRELCSAKMLV